MGFSVFLLRSSRPTKASHDVIGAIGGEGGGDGEADGGGDGEADGGGDGEADGGGDGEADGGGDGGDGGGSHWVALGAGSHVSRTSRLEWQRASNGGSAFGLYCSGSSGEYTHGEKVPSMRVM